MIFSRRQNFVLAWIYILVAGGFASAQTSRTAFPGAEGFGADASGGRSGEVYHVTT
jgi:hypothetical protein